MELSNIRIVPAAPAVVWEALNDPATLQACIPGCESFERDADGHWRATVATRIGPVSARFAGRVELADVTPPTGYTLKFSGQGGAAGFANGEARVQLAPAGEGTSIAYTASAQVGGKIAQIGSRLIDGVAAKLADDFFARLAERLSVAEPAGVAAADPRMSDSVAPDRAWVRYAALAAIVVLLAWLAARGGVRF
ncbi:MAG: carbon monoxide dehydrogenase subunit G [Betaproteobacteria bacterium]